jgi:hypothetical protein
VSFDPLHVDAIRKIFLLANVAQAGALVVRK